MATREKAKAEVKEQLLGHRSASLPPPSPPPDPSPQSESQPSPLPLPNEKPRFSSFKDMPVWQSAMSVAESVFMLTEKLPRKEDYGFTSQIRRAALSVSANIAEAFGRSHTLDKVNFYYVARGSVTETQSHLEYAKRVGYFDPKTAKHLSDSLTTIYSDLNKVILSLKQKGKGRVEG
jgi:four helix bundle protein